jgi:3-dehydroquinate dehydratase
MENELEVRLESMIETLQEIQDVLSKSQSNRESVDMTILYKNIEDGILDNIQNANNKQLNHIINDYRFRYYTDFNTDKELLRSEITKRLRDIKLNKIL